MSASFGGPVSAHLEAEVRALALRRRIVVWLDMGGHYTGVVDRLIGARAAGDLPYQVYGLRGSYLALLLDLDGVAAGAEAAPVVIHLPGHTEESVRGTPLLEHYLAGVRYRKALGTLVTEAAAGLVRPEQIAAFLGGCGASVGEGGEKSGEGVEAPAVATGDLTVEGADAWLAAHVSGGEGGLADALRALSPAALIADLLGHGPIAQAVQAHPASAQAILDRFAASLGLPAPWREAMRTPGQPTPEALVVAAASWALAVEYTHDLGRAPVSAHLAAARTLARPLVEACRALASELRDRHRALYGRMADETEALLADERSASRAEDLGRIDTFRFEETTILDAALRALEEGRWADAAQFATDRLDGGSFWVREEPARQSAWQLIASAARLGLAVAGAGHTLGPVDGLDEVLARYVERGAAVDRAHRHLEERRWKLLYPQIPRFEVIQSRLDGLRAVWRQWADRWTLDVHAACRAHGWLPSPALQQRRLFDDVVRPLSASGGPVAYFLVDALRFEMASELFEALRDTPATIVHLRARMAELPTVTEVGMNALAPVAPTGRLRAALAGGRLEGFTAGEARVHDPDSRKRAMQARVGGATCPWLTLAEVTSRDVASLKRSIARAQLVVVHSREIDEAGERGAGPAVFQDVLQKLRAAWTLLRAADVRRFVITADHGFLLVDPGTNRRQPHGRKIDPKARYVLTKAAADRDDEVHVPLADLGYEGPATEGWSAVFPASTAVFDTGQRVPGFVHGGPSLQERVIPVLTLEHKAPVGGSTQRYRVAAEVLSGVAGMHCLAVRVEPVANSELAFGVLQEIELAMRVRDPAGADLQVELCDTRSGARLDAGALIAPVGAPFELFFRLTGRDDARVQVELYHPGRVAQVEPSVPTTRFEVSAVRGGPPRTGDRGGAAAEPATWLEALPDDGTRALFCHLEAHGSVTEEEAALMLGGARALRRFAGRFEDVARHAPFVVRIVSVGGVKRYEREGHSR